MPEMKKFPNAQNSKFLEFSKLEIFGIVQINKFLDLFQLGKPTISILISYFSDS